MASEKWWKFSPVMWAHNPSQLKQSQPKFRPTNHERVMVANRKPCLILHWQSDCHQARTVKQSTSLPIISLIWLCLHGVTKHGCHSNIFLLEVTYQGLFLSPGWNFNSVNAALFGEKYYLYMYMIPPWGPGFLRKNMSTHWPLGDVAVNLN